MAVKNDISLQTFVVAKENGFACSGRRGSDLPRLILFFVAAKENGFACSGRSGNDVRVRFYSPRTALRHNRARLPSITPESPGAVARALLSENHLLDEWGLVGVWDEGEGGEWLRDNQGGALPRGY